jgi:hypothetical protein
MIYVTNLNNQLNITYGTRKDVYAFDSIKSVSFSWDTNGEYYVAINFIANDKNNSLRIYLKDVDPTLLWANDFNGATLAVNTIALWMGEVITVNASIVSPIGQTTMSNSVAVVIASNQTGVPITDNGGSLTVDGTVSLSTTTLTALENITVQNPGGASAVNIQDGGNSITVDGGTGVSRTPTILRTSTSSSVAAGAYSVSFASVGTVDSTVGGATLKPGETINFDAGAINNTLGAITYNSSTAGAELLIITLT